MSLQESVSAIVETLDVPPPHDLRAERKILGWLVHQDARSFGHPIFGDLHEHLFYSQCHRIMFQAWEFARDRNDVVWESWAERLERYAECDVPNDYVTEVLETGPFSQREVIKSIRRVMNLYRKREVIHLATRVLLACYDATSDSADVLIGDIYESLRRIRKLRSIEPK